MAKVIRGGRRVGKRDPVQRYGRYKSKGALLRRAAHPEYYMHSWSQKVRKNRNIFAEAMVTYSKLDIVTKQAYTEAIRIVPLLPPPPEARRAYEKIRRKIDEFRQRYHTAVPMHILQHSPYYRTFIQPAIGISPEAWNAYLNQIRLNKVYNRGHEQFIWDYIGWYEHKDTEPQPFPNELPLPQQEKRKLIGDRVPITTIVIEIEPSGISGAVYNLAVEVQTEYHTIKRFVSAHKKEILIIVAIGAFIWLGWEMMIGGGIKIAGGEALINELVMLPLMEQNLKALAIPFRVVKDYFYKKMVVGWAEDVNLVAWNESRGHFCYKETKVEDNVITWNFYEGRDRRRKGKLACWAKLEVDPDSRTGNLTWGCGPSTDRTILFYNGAQIHACNVPPLPCDIVTLWNNTTQEWGEARITYEGNKKIYAFEDRPSGGDYDYNDAYVIEEYDEQGNLKDIRVIDGEHADELFVYWRGMLIGYLPGR